MPAGVEGLRFESEAATANAWVRVLKKQNVRAIVVLIHEGGVPCRRRLQRLLGGLWAHCRDCRTHVRRHRRHRLGSHSPRVQLHHRQQARDERRGVRPHDHRDRSDDRQAHCRSRLERRAQRHRHARCAKRSRPDRHHRALPSVLLNSGEQGRRCDRSRYYAHAESRRGVGSGRCHRRRHSRSRACGVRGGSRRVHEPWWDSRGCVPGTGQGIP